MTIKLVCQCSRALNLLEDLAGKHIHCPACRAIIRVPDVQAKSVKPKNEKPRSVRKKRPVPAVSEWDASYDEYGTTNNYPGDSSAQRGVRTQRKGENAPSDAERIVQMLFSWPIVLGVTLTFMATGIWIFLPELKGLVPAFPVAADPASLAPAILAPVANAAQTPNSHQISFDDICFVTFPGKPEDSSRSAGWRAGVIAGRDCIWHDDQSGNALSAISLTFQQQFIDEASDSSEMFLDGLAEALLKKQVGHTIHQKATKKIQDYSVMDLSFSFPAGTSRGESYPAGVSEIRMFIKDSRVFWFEIEADELNSPVNRMQKEAFFNSIRFSDVPVEGTETITDDTL